MSHSTLHIVTSCSIIGSERFLWREAPTLVENVREQHDERTYRGIKPPDTFILYDTAFFCMPTRLQSPRLIKFTRRMKIGPRDMRGNDTFRHCFLRTQLRASECATQCERAAEMTPSWVKTYFPVTRTTLLGQLCERNVKKRCSLYGVQVS